MRVDIRPRHRNAPRPAEKSAKGFLQWIRGRSCLLSATGQCGGKIEAAHVDYAGGKGISTKVRDSAAVPLCTWHHAEQHRIGWRRFEAKYALKAIEVADFLWSRWPGRFAWEHKQQQSASRAQQ